MLCLELYMQRINWVKQLGYVYFLIVNMYLYNVMCFLCFSFLVLGDVPINVFES